MGMDSGKDIFDVNAPIVPLPSTNEVDSRKSTLEHRNEVYKLMYSVVKELFSRADKHDESKMLSPELEVFNEFTPKLAGSTYGSEEYMGYLRKMQVALDHHYASNRHHPEFHADGISGMNLIDLLEMICDWTAATKRHNDGDILASIEINQSRFNYSNELKSILLNTVIDLGLVPGEETSFKAG